MTLFRFFATSTYRHYLYQLMDSVIPSQKKSAIFLRADFSNPKQTISVDFEDITEIV